MDTLPKTGLAMSLAAAPFALSGQRNAAVALVLRVERPAPEQAGRISEIIDVHAAACAPGGKRRAGGSSELQFDLPLAPLVPGLYLLTVEATVDKTTARREVRFEVR